MECMTSQDNRSSFKVEFKGLSVQSWVCWGELLSRHHLLSFQCEGFVPWGCSKVAEKSWKSFFPFEKTSLRRGIPSRRRSNCIDTLWLDEEIYVWLFSHVLVPLPAVIFQQAGIRGGSLPVRTLHHIHERSHSPRDSGSWQVAAARTRASTRMEALKEHRWSDPMNAWPRRPLIMGYVHSARRESPGRVLICLLTVKRAALQAHWIMTVFRPYWKTGAVHTLLPWTTVWRMSRYESFGQSPSGLLYTEEIINSLPVKKTNQHQQYNPAWLAFICGGDSDLATSFKVACKRFLVLWILDSFKLNSLRMHTLIIVYTQCVSFPTIRTVLMHVRIYIEHKESCIQLNTKDTISPTSLNFL